MENVGLKAKQGFKWILIARTSAQVLTWLSSIVVIRFVSPKDYGLVAMAEVVFTLLFMFSTSGLGEGLIQKKTINKLLLKKMLGFLLLINVGLAVFQYFLSPLISHYYDEPEISSILRVLAIVYLTIPWIVIPYSVLSREIEFKHRALVDLLSSVLSAIASLTLAISGFGVWALVAAILVLYGAKMIGYNIVKPTSYLPSFRLTGMHSILRFGVVVTLTGFVWSLFTKVDIFVGGYFLDAETLGIYAVAVHLSLLPMTKMVPIINQVTLPVYSSLQQDIPKIKTYVLLSIRLASFLAFPLFFGMIAIANYAVPLILGEKWVDVVVPFSILCLSVPFRLIMNLFSPAVKAIGRPNIGLVNAIFMLLVTSIAMYIGAQRGIIEMSYAWLISTPIIFVFSVFRSGRPLSISLAEVIKSTYAPFVASMLMLLVIMIFQASFRELLPGYGLTLLGVLAGGAFYFFYMIVFNKELLRELQQVIRK